MAGNMKPNNQISYFRNTPTSTNLYIMHSHTLYPHIFRCYYNDYMYIDINVDGTEAREVAKQLGSGDYLIFDK